MIKDRWSDMTREELEANLRLVEIQIADCQLGRDRQRQAESQPGQSRTRKLSKAQLERAKYESQFQNAMAQGLLTQLDHGKVGYGLCPTCGRLGAKCTGRRDPVQRP